MNAAMVEILKRHCPLKAITAGTVLRYRRGFGEQMLLILEGEVEVQLGEGDHTQTLTLGRHSIIGEIGFLTGKGATAKVAASTAVSALGIGHEEIRALERVEQQTAIELQRHLARLARSRLAQNEVLLEGYEDGDESGFEIVGCTTPELLGVAQNLRYEVYCGEFGRSSPYADPETRRIVDPLDAHGFSFVAYHNGEAVGTTRVNLARHGELGVLPEIYGMAKSSRHPATTSVITKYAIRESWRGGSAYMRLFGAIATLIDNAGVEEIFIDCNPTLARFYSTMGFRQCEAEFMHYENGLSVPMVLDIPDYRARMPLAERQRRNRWR